MQQWWKTERVELLFSICNSLEVYVMACLLAMQRGGYFSLFMMMIGQQFSWAVVARYSHALTWTRGRSSFAKAEDRNVWNQRAERVHLDHILIFKNFLLPLVKISCCPFKYQSYTKHYMLTLFSVLLTMGVVPDTSAQKKLQIYPQVKLPSALERWGCDTHYRLKCVGYRLNVKKKKKKNLSVGGATGMEMGPITPTAPLWHQRV